MVNHRRDYDQILETYSKPLLQFIRYEKKPDGSLVVTNPEKRKVISDILTLQNIAFTWQRLYTKLFQRI